MAAEHVASDSCTADQRSFTTCEDGHVSKAPFFPPCSSIAPEALAASESAAFKKQCHGQDFIIHNACEGVGARNIDCRGGACRCCWREDRENRMGWNAVWNHGEQKDRGRSLLLLVVGVLSVVAMLVSVCSIVNVLQQGAEMEELRQTVKKLDVVCAKGNIPFTSAPHPRAGPEGDDAFPPDISHPAVAMLPSSSDPRVSRQNVEGTYDDDNGDAYDDDDDDVDNDDHENEEDERGDSLYAFLHARPRHKRSSRKKKPHKGSSRVCKKLKNCMKAKDSGKRVKKNCKRMLQCLPPPTPPAIKPVHFMGTFSKHERQKKFDKEAPLHFNAEAEWMGHLYRDRSQQPILSLGDGGYNVTQAGVYFIYTSVMFHDIKPRQSQSLVVNGKKRLKCMDSVDFVNRTMTMEDQRKYKTCAISGLLHLKVGDRLEVQNLYAQTEIDQSEDSTYFGALLLVPLELKRP